MKTIAAKTYAGTGGGVFKSTDGGGGWTAANTGLIATAVSGVALYPQAPSTLYAGTSDRVFKSSDGGGSWSAVTIGPSPDASRQMAIDPQTPRALYASTYAKLFKSADGGSSWSAVNVLRIRNILALAVDPQTPATVYVGTNGDNLFRSTDGGSTWSSVGPVSTQFLFFDPQSPATVYAGTDYGLFKSINGGASFSRTGLDGVTGVYAMVVDPQAPDTLYAGTRSFFSDRTGVVKSTDGSVGAPPITGWAPSPWAVLWLSILRL